MTDHPSANRFVPDYGKKILIKECCECGVEPCCGIFFPFGQYKGYCIRRIINDDIRYVVWTLNFHEWMCAHSQDIKGLIHAVGRE